MRRVAEIFLTSGSGDNAGMSACFVTRALPGSALEALTERHATTVWPGELPPTPGELRAALAACEPEALICTVSDRIDGAVLDAAPRLRAIANYAVGYDNIDLAEAAARGIAVGNTPDVLTDATADLAFALLLAAARRLPEGIARVRSGQWVTWEPSRDLGAAVHGATLGIVGGGRIGAAVARRAAGFEMTVLIHSRRTETTFEELLERSDFVSLHCPLTDETRHLLGAAALARMKPGAILINTSRGGVVDQDALAEALRDGVIAGAALDVTDPEPLPAQHPLLRAPHLIVVPHIGSATVAARQAMGELAVQNVLSALAGEPMPHPVSPPPAPGT
jgi:glyoxylate reductase